MHDNVGCGRSHQWGNGDDLRRRSAEELDLQYSSEKQTDKGAWTHLFAGVLPAGPALGVAPGPVPFTIMARFAAIAAAAACCCAKAAC